MKSSVLLLTLPALALFNGCTSVPPAPPPVSEEQVHVEAGIPGGVIINTTELRARVKSIDLKKRQAVLVDSDGKEHVVDVPESARNLDQVKRGDLVVLATTEQIVIVVLPAGTPVEQGFEAAAMRAEKGAKPGVAAVSVLQLKGTITAIDTAARTATLRFDDGTEREVAVRDDIDLTQHRVGEQVVVRISNLVEIAVEAAAR